MHFFHTKRGLFVLGGRVPGLQGNEYVCSEAGGLYLPQGRAAFPGRKGEVKGGRLHHKEGLVTGPGADNPPEKGAVKLPEFQSDIW